MKLKNHNLLVKLILKCYKLFKNENIYKYWERIENNRIMDNILKNKKNKTNKNLKLVTLRKSNKEIAKIRIANTFFSRLMGLMFKKNAKVPLLFEIPERINKKERSSIHSFFMRFEIVLVFIDKDNVVYEIAELKPWNWHIPKKPAKYILEFDKREFNSCLKIGEEIEIK